MPAGLRAPEKRGADLRRSLLDAAVNSLVEVGFARTTTLEVQRRAGVSRGALLHHFPSKAQLLAATIEHLADMRGRDLKRKTSELPSDPGERINAVLDLLWDSFAGPLFQVVLELKSGARTEPELRRVLTVAERVVRDRILRQSGDLFGAAVATQPGFESAMDLTLHLMIGAATTALLHGEEARVETLIARWKAVFPTLLTMTRTESTP
jgi:AcrR family transcriptional regulator